MKGEEDRESVAKFVEELRTIFGDKK